MQRKRSRAVLSWLLVLGLILSSGVFTFAYAFNSPDAAGLDSELDGDQAIATAAADDPVLYAPVRTIKTPVAGQYPISFYRNTIRDKNSTANSGMTQTLSWFPDIDDKGFATNTAYTAVLELEPGAQSNWTSAGFPGAPNFSANSITWENLRNLPTEGVDTITSEYFTGPASGNYSSRPAGLAVADAAGANLRVFIKFLPTAAVKSEPEVIFFDDFNGTQRTGADAVNGTTTSFIRGTQQKRQDAGAYWTNGYSNLMTDPKNPNNKVLVLSWGIADYTFATQQVTASSLVSEAPTRPAVPPTALTLRNTAGNYVLEILLDVAIYDADWMGKNYISAAFSMTTSNWKALTLQQKLAAWNALPADLKLEVWNAFWPVTWTDGREYGRRNFVRAGCWDTRGGSGVDPFQNAYGYYEVNMKMTPANGVWTAFWMNGESTGGGSGGTADSTITDISRVKSYNPMLDTMTAANRLSAIQRQSSWHGSEIDIIENCEPVLERGYSSSYHYGGYGGYGNGRQHQESWMPGEADWINNINIYDGEFHRIGFEWSPTDGKFYIDDILHACASDITTHWPEFVQDKDQVTNLPFLDGKLGIPQNPNMMRLSVEADYWSGHGTEYEYYPYDCGVGIREDRSLGRLTEGTLENGGAAVIDYVKVINGPKPDGDSVLVYLSAPEESDIDQNTEFTLSIGNTKDLLTFEAEILVDGSMLSGIGVEPLNGFKVMDSVLWSYAGDGLWKGTVTLAYKAGFREGFTTHRPLEIAKFLFAPRAKGDTVAALANVTASGLVGDVTQYFGILIQEGTAATNIDQRVFSKYDLNRDGIVDALDLGIMLLYCGFAETTPGWNSLVKVNDSRGKGVTASMCDVNGDDIIDMLDLLDLFIHYTK
ncbi:MAG: family 16 glycosylhydrolase [Clostridiales bacterium]|nr:family 16 glycosylhydrolase [Clostridiales bacterium]